MPIESRAQAGLMGMSQSPEGRAKLKAEGKAPVPAKVAAEFFAATKKKISKLPAHQSGVHRASLAS